MSTFSTRIISVLISLILFLPAVGQDRGSSSEGIKQAIEIIASDPTFSEAIIGVSVCTEDGTTLAQVNERTKLVPASNMKLITTGAALHTLGGEFRYETSIGYKGVIQDGVLKGDLYIIGGGDPTIGSKDSIAYGLKRTFSQWEKMIKDSGIREIDGHIIGDGRWSEGMAEESTWSYQDIGTYYGTGVTGLMFYENMASYIAKAGDEVGSPTEFITSYPEMPWMRIINESSTGRQGSGDKTFMYTSEFTPDAVIRGTLAVGINGKRVDFSNKFPEYTCARYFEDFLNEKGIPCTRGAADFRFKKEWMKEDMPDEEITIIGRSKSPELRKIVFSTNHISNNLFAETLFKTLGRQILGSTSYKTSSDALKSVLKEMGLNTEKGIYIQDGSGLSRQNYISPDFICRFLKRMTSSPCFGDFLASLPSPGFDGSLFYNMKSYPEELRSRIKVKSGSMNGVRCYSGYVLPSEEDGQIIIFSILTGNCTAPTWKTRQLLDKLMATIAEAN